MKEIIISLISKELNKDKSLVSSLLEVPQDSKNGDYAFPCFMLAKELKKNPVEIAKDLSSKIELPKELEKIEASGPYLNFFINRNLLAQSTLNKILKEKDKYGSNKSGKDKKIVIDMSSPNIAKPFGIGHLRSTMIGNALSNLGKTQGYKVVKINYLGDWGTPFGKIIAGYTEFGDPVKFKMNPISHLYDIYVQVSKDPEFEEKGRIWFKKLCDGDKEAISLWKNFREESLKEFEKIYNLLGVSFDVITGESEYEKYIPAILKDLEKKRLIKKDQGAMIVDLKEYGLGICLIQKSDGTTLYATRDLALAVQRYKKYSFSQMIYEVGSEQKLNFQQLFKVLELMGYEWAKNCVHVAHGLYLDSDGKKFATRKGKTVFMSDVLFETVGLAKKEIMKREKLDEEELESRALAIARAAIIYGDLKNYLENNAIFDIEKFLSFEGDTGPYLLYTYARARSILSKNENKSKKVKTLQLTDKEKSLIVLMSSFPDIVKKAYESLSPNIIANYSFQLAQSFNEFYHSDKVIGSDNEQFRLKLVESFSQVLRNSLSILGIPVLDKM